MPILLVSAKVWFQSLKKIYKSVFVVATFLYFSLFLLQFGTKILELPKLPI